MRLDLAELAVRSFKDGDSDIHGILSIANQHAFEMAEVVEVEKVASNAGGSVRQETGVIAEPDVSVEDDDYH